MQQQLVQQKWQNIKIMQQILQHQKCNIKLRNIK